MSNKLLYDILPYWSNEMNHSKVKFNKKNVEYLIRFYNEIKRAKNEYNKYKKNITYVVEKLDKTILLSNSLYNSSYLPFEIKKEIMKEIRYITKSTIKLITLPDSPEITLMFYTKYKMPSSMILENVEYIFTVANVCYSQRKQDCGKKININIILSKCKKMLPINPTITLGPYHVNSAVTTDCMPDGEILVFRSEEWTKTLIHEMFHILGLDFSSHFRSSIKSNIKKKFFVNSTYNLYEIYSEFMAILLHVCMISYKLIQEDNVKNRENKENKSNFVFYVETLLTYEQYFSNFQQTKILNSMNIEREMFDKALTQRKYRNMLIESYKENTNVFCYYILKTTLLNNINSVLLWLQLNNQTLLQFNNSEKCIQNFTYFLERCFYNEFNGNVKKLDDIHTYLIESKREDKNYNVLLNTMRMSINDYF